MFGEKKKPQSISEKLSYLLKTRKGFYLIVAFFALLLLPLGFLFSQQRISVPTIPTEESKIWQITFAYHTDNGMLSVKAAKITSGFAIQSPLTESPYKVVVLDKDKGILFQTHITITQTILYNSYNTSNGAENVSVSLPKTIETQVSIPYYQNAEKVEVLENNKRILEFSPPKKTTFNLVEKIYAADNTQACGPVHVIFISEGYTDMNQFHRDVADMKQRFMNTAPYASYLQVLDMSKEIENPASNPLGCINGSSLVANCVLSPSINNQVQNMIFSKFPNLPQNGDYVKAVILVYANPEWQGGNSYLLGGAAFPGWLSAFSMKPNSNFPPQYRQDTPVHEVLGHSIGRLFDRYTYSNPSPMFAQLIQQYQSNCSLSSGGNSFWSSVGVTTAYPGCTIAQAYAPAPNDCNPGRGSRDSIMSAGECASNHFDPVERKWLEDNILKVYAAQPSCNAVPTATPVPTSVVSTPRPTIPGVTTAIPTPAVTSGVTQYSIQVKTFEDKNGNNSIDTNEDGVPNVQVFLGTSGGDKQGTTNSQGSYSFSDLSAGSYTIKKIILKGREYPINSNTLPVPPSQIQMIAIPSNLLALPPITPTPTSGLSSTPQPTAASPTIVSGGGGSGGSGAGSGGGVSLYPTLSPEPLVLYTCTPKTAVTPASSPNGKPITVTWVDCKPL